MQKEVEIFLPLVLMTSCVAVLFTIAQPVVFLACALGIFIVVATILFRDKLTYAFVFALSLMPRFVGIQLPGGLPDITCTRVLILYYFGFSLLLNRKTIFANLKRLRLDAVNIAMLVFVATYLLVFLAHRDRAAINAVFVTLFENVFVFYFIFLNIRDYKEVKGCFTALLLSACVLCLFAMFEFATGVNVFTYYGNLGNFSRIDPGGNLKRLGVTRVFASFAHPIAMAGYLLLIFPVAFNFFLNERKQLKKFFLLALSGLLLATMLLALSRMPLLCCALGLVLLFVVVNREQKVTFLKIFCAALVVGAGCFAVGVVPKFVVDMVSSIAPSLKGEYVENFGGRGGFGERLNLIQVTKEVLQGNPLLGGGLGYLETHEIYFFDYQRNPFKKYLVDSFDNDYIKNLLKGGIVGLVGYLTLYGALLFQACAAMRAEMGNSLNVIAQAVFVAMFTYLLSLFSVDNLGTFKIFLTIAAVFVAAIRENPSVEDDALYVTPGVLEPQAVYDTPDV